MSTHTKPKHGDIATIESPVTGERFVGMYVQTFQQDDGLAYEFLLPNGTSEFYDPFFIKAWGGSVFDYMPPPMNIDFDS